jgi:hypothetical protein
MSKMAFFYLILLVGCATKMRTPLNRFMGPESVGGSLNSEVQYGMGSVAQGRLDVSSSAPYDMEISEEKGNHYLWALSLVPKLDVTWNHMSDGISLVGLRYQFFGNPQTANPQGYNMGMTLGIGANEHETETDPKLKFKLSGKDFSLLHSYWPWSFLSFYNSVFFSRYEATGDLSSKDDPSLDAPFNQKSTQFGTNIGMEFKVWSIDIKLEYCLTRVKWSKSNAKYIGATGLAIGATF